MSFKQLHLSSKIIKACQDKGYKEPTQVQKDIIPYLLRGKDLVVIAKTGTGKTAGFVLPMLQDIQQRSKQEKKRALTKLIIAPTRELVDQLTQNIKEYAKYLDIKIVPIYGGANINSQIKQLKQGANIVVATTGRLKELIQTNNLNTSHIDTLVLDEADTMLDMGFVADIQDILGHLPQLSQTILCSATISPNIKKLSSQLLKNPKFIELKSTNKVNENIQQIIYPVASSDKLEMLSYIISSQNMQQVLVFCKTKKLSNEIVQFLNSYDLSAEVINSEQTFAKRKKTIQKFKNNNLRVIVATDVAARGIDIKELFYVINFDVPFLQTDYIHRIGRTARANNNGVAITLLDEYDMLSMQKIEQYLKQKIKRIKLDGFEVPKKITMLSKKKIIEPAPKKTNGAFGRKKAKKQSKNEPKLRGKRIIGQKRGQ
jgi:superfamily II DNA/RNA helicase